MASSLPKITLTVLRPASETELPGNGEVIANLSIVNPPVSVTWAKIGGDAPVDVTTEGVVTTTDALVPGSTYTFTVRATETNDPNAFLDQTITIRTGTNGDDTLDGDETIDLIYALDGADTLNGGDGHDSLFGQAGDDELTGGAGDDIIEGGDGDDTIHYAINDGADSMEGGAGIDTLNITGGAAGDSLHVLFDGGITAVGGTLINGVPVENDATLSNIEIVNVDLGSGVNRLDYRGSIAGVSVDLAAGMASGFDHLANVQNVIGTRTDDILTGDINANNLSGSSGNDILNGGDGNDLLIGGGQDDTVNGEAGDDTIRYTIGEGSDTIDGGEDIDQLIILGTTNLATLSSQTLDVIYDGTSVTTFEDGTITNVEQVSADLGAGNFDALVYAGTTADVVVNLGTGTASGFTSIAGVENVTGGDGNDLITGNSGRNVLSGGTGIDTLNGGAGSDVLVGGDGIDTISADGNGVNDRDGATDFIRFTAVSEFGDTINTFQATGGVGVRDLVQFGGVFNTPGSANDLDDGNNNNRVSFITGNGANGGNTAVTLNGAIEGLFLDGQNDEGVTFANLRNAGLVAAEFNNEFAITAANGEATLLVINDTNANSASVWQWVQTAGGTAEIDANELTLIGVINADATVTTASFTFF